MKRIKIAPYGCYLHVTDNFSEWARVYKRLTGKVVQNDSAGLTYDHDNGHHYVGIFRGGLNTTVHELSHVCLYLADRVQLGDVTQEQEAFCYLIGHLTDEVLKRYPQLRGIS
ncbi:hypothetical protein D3C86_849200 [compost metagenome]